TLGHRLAGQRAEALHHHGLLRQAKDGVVGHLPVGHQVLRGRGEKDFHRRGSDVARDSPTRLSRPAEAGRYTLRQLVYCWRTLKSHIGSVLAAFLLSTTAQAANLSLGPGVPVSAQVDIHPASGLQDFPKVASNGRDFVAVWTDLRIQGWGAYADIF